jgi:hypothetical protein
LHWLRAALNFRKCCFMFRCNDYFLSRACPAMFQSDQGGAGSRAVRMNNASLKLSQDSDTGQSSTSRQRTEQEVPLCPSPLPLAQNQHDPTGPMASDLAHLPLGVPSPINSRFLLPEGVNHHLKISYWTTALSQIPFRNTAGYTKGKSACPREVYILMVSSPYSPALTEKYSMAP